MRRLILIVIISSQILFFGCVRTSSSGSYDNGITIDNGIYIIKIGGRNSSKPGMIESLTLKGIPFQFSADYGYYNLFFPEFHIVRLDFKGTEAGAPGVRNSPYAGRTYIEKVWKRKDYTFVKVVWKNGWIDASWVYIIPHEKNFFTVDIRRTVKKSFSYTNFQQCTMVNPEMKMSYIVQWNGKFTRNFDAYHGLISSTTYEHIMFNQIDKGDATRYPAFAWYNKEHDVSIGMITTWVSPEQRKTITYHGGGSSMRHPGFGEGQWNWFGEADDGSKYLEKGTTFGMEIVYVVGRGSPDRVVDKFNREIFSRSIDRGMKPAPDYLSAGWGGRRTIPGPDNWKYNYNFPSISGNWITDHFLFAHNSFIIPALKKGVSGRKDSLFSLWVKWVNGDGSIVNLTPVYSPHIKPVAMGRYSAGTTEEGWVEWKIGDILTRVTIGYTRGQKETCVHIRTTSSRKGSPFVYIEKGKGAIATRIGDFIDIHRKNYGIVLLIQQDTKITESSDSIKIPFRNSITLTLIPHEKEVSSPEDLRIIRKNVKLYYRDMVPPEFLGGFLPYEKSF